MKKVLKNKKAFTLTEMIVVIAIIGILAGVLIPTITGYIKRANQSAAYQKAEAVLNVYETWETEYNAELTELTFANYYLEITGVELEQNIYYFEYTGNSEENYKKAFFVSVIDNITVRINLETNNVSYEENDYVNELEWLFEKANSSGYAMKFESIH